MRGQVIAVTGIDTGVGKTVATGLLAKAFAASGRSVITQKVAQTGCSGIAEDIVAHRALMGIGLQEVDLDGTTCPFVFGFPASPHLAAALEGRHVDVMAIRRSTFLLRKRYDLVLLEGAGGLLVPLDEGLLFGDYLRDAGYGLILVTSPRLGSINHTLLTLEACQLRGIELRGLVFNRYGEVDGPMPDDTRRVIGQAMKRLGIEAPIIDMDAGGFAPGSTDLLAI